MINQYVSKQTTSRVLLAFVVWGVFFVVPSFAVPRRYAMVVAVSKFDAHGAPDIPFVDVDAQMMIERLESLGFSVDAYCDESLGVKNSQSPTRENVLCGLNEKLNGKVGPNDVVFIYVSSHGDAVDDKTYLLAKDSKVKTQNGVTSVVPSTALAASELREGANNLRAKNVFLAFDACHSGGTRGSNGAGYRDVLNYLPLEDDFEVATLASCSANQTSGAISKNGKEISHFTYWLVEGLKGYADENGDGEITTVELSNYVQRNVTYTCDLLISREKIGNLETRTAEQSPYVVASPNAEPFVFAKIKSASLLNVVDDAAEQVATRLYVAAKKQKTRKLSLMVDVFTISRQFVSERARDAAAAFRNSFNERFKRSVEKKLSDVLVEIEFNSEAVSKGNVPTFRCEIGSPKDANASYFEFSGVLSGLKTADGDDASECKIVSKIAYDEDVDARLGNVNEDDDLADSVSVWIEVVKNGKIEKRVPKEIDGALWVPLDVGEKYRIAYNLTRVPTLGVGVRALVDGRNFLAQYESYVAPKFSVIDPASEEEAEDDLKDASNEASAKSEIIKQAEPTEVARPLASLGEARFWVVKKPGRHTISGFYTRTMNEDQDSNAILEPFVVAANNEGARQNDDVGSILVAFYRLTGRRGSGPSNMRTVPTEERPSTLTRVDGLEIKEGQKPYACFSLRYASSEALERFEQDPEAFYESVEEAVETEEIEFY